MELRFRLPALLNTLIYPRLLLLPAVAILLVLTTGWLIERLDTERFRQAERLSVLNALSTIRARIEGAFNGSVLLTRGLVADIAHRPVYDQARFVSIARELMAQSSLVRNFAAAPDLVITYIYPVAGNESAIGLDLQKHPTQRETALRARDSGEIVINGPVDLIQSGHGFIARVPVFLSVDGNGSGDNPFWGLVSTVIDVDALYREAGLLDPALPLQIAIRGRDGLGAKGDVFFGDAALFNADAMLLDISLAGGSWQIAALPKGGWSATAPAVWAIRTMVAVVALLIGALVLLRVLAQTQRDAVEQKLRRSVAELYINKQAIDASPDGIAVVDQDCRYLYANRACSEKHGMTPQQIIGHCLAEFLDGEVLINTIQPKLDRCLAGEVVEYEAWFFYKSLGRRFMNVRYTPICSDSGGVSCVVAVLHDITERRQAERVLRHLAEGTAGVTGQDFFSGLVQHLATALEARYALIGELIAADPPRIRTIAVWAGDCLGKNFEYTVVAPTGEAVIDRDSCCRPRDVRELFPDDRLLAEMGAEGYVGAPLFSSHGEPLGVLGVLHDQAMANTDLARSMLRIFAARAGAELEREWAEAARRRSEERLIDAIESISEGFVLWDENDRMVLCNSRYLEFYPMIAHLCRPGVAFEDLIRFCAANGKMLLKGSLEDWVQARLASRRGGQRGFKERLPGGRWIYITEMKTAAGGLVGIYSDITELKKAEEDIHFRAFFDPLTELPNRMNFIEHLEEALARNLRSHSRLALMFIDLDRFKNVNDSLGHMVGDALLKEAALRIRGCVRITDTVARLGGDEFTVILSDLSDDMQATRAAEAIIERLAQPYHLLGYEVYAGASIGITLCPADGADCETLLKNADMAMYRAKESGRNTFRYFTGEMTERAEQLVALEKDLRRAVEHGEFVVFYQPIIELNSDTVVGAEALVRWRHPMRGLVMPGAFIEVAEDTGLIDDIGMDVLRAACLDAVAASEGAATRCFPYLSVNVSSRQFKTGLDGDRVALILAETAFPANRLMFEITESLLMDEDKRVRQALNDFRDMGIRLSLDDFGTGYSSLGYLRRFPVDVVKIDRSFVRDIVVDAHDRQLVEAIITMGHSLGLCVIAEGVESSEQAALLRRLRCDMAQGYLFGQPEPLPVLSDRRNAS